MKRLALALAALLTFGGFLSAQQAPSPLVQALSGDQTQRQYLSRHPEILRWVAKHPEQTLRLADKTSTADDKAKNKVINEWIGDQPVLARLLASEPDQALAWAEEPRTLADLGKKNR